MKKTIKIKTTDLTVGNISAQDRLYGLSEWTCGDPEGISSYTLVRHKEKNFDILIRFRNKKEIIKLGNWLIKKANSFKMKELNIK